MAGKTKWYENPLVDKGPVLSSRLRLARNLSGYPFPSRLKPHDSLWVKTLSDAVLNSKNAFREDFYSIPVNELSETQRLSLMEKQAISREMVYKTNNRSLIINKDETISIMLGEEDHARIQSVFPGENIEAAFQTAMNIEKLMAESVEFAFDLEFGYLTSCPTNTGTGMRAGFMLHLPMLERGGYLQSIASYLAKMGYAIRGIHGEGTESMGSIYQLSNQITLGKSEEEIIEGLHNILEQITERETALEERLTAESRWEMEDRACRALGIISNCVMISSEEAMSLLSDLRMGINGKLIALDLPKTLYCIMTDIQRGNVELRAGRNLDTKERARERANYLKKIFSNR